MMSSAATARLPGERWSDIIPRSIARMMTDVEWTDFSGNQWIGCTRIAAVAGALSGCDICYAASFAEQRLGMTWGSGAPRRFMKGFAARMARLNRLAASTVAMRLLPASWRSRPPANVWPGVTVVHALH
ncbi:MAG: hypothetical protein KAY22_04495 [Rhizorhabdus sp.]|uniref:hypothetical protein n=1 Tax=Rhizorhabdus sp. TaxID=1968843 RepID=UPI001B612058|nr:hypothetical protein [Rhizorhabdus sp.]MBP8231544.1 hypothetical protein [Rhizorhabdus sp.]